MLLNLQIVICVSIFKFKNHEINVIKNSNKYCSLFMFLGILMYNISPNFEYSLFGQCSMKYI